MYDEGHILLHYEGKFDASESTYVGGKQFKIEEFFIETLDLFHLQLLIKRVGLKTDYKMWHKYPNEERFVEIYRDKHIEKMLENLTVETPVDLYIEHLAAEEEEEEQSEEESSGPASSSSGNATNQYVYDFMTYKINEIVDALNSLG